MGLHVVFRADASANLGGGHISRCLALADSLALSGCACTFATKSATMDAAPLLGKSAHRIVASSDVDCFDALSRLIGMRADLLVVDHYELGGEFERGCKSWCRKILAIDDLANRHHECDFLVDQTLGRKPEDYHHLVSPQCMLLLGPGYALLRPSFASLRSVALQRRTGDVRRILVSIGGSDPHDITSMALRAIRAAGYREKLDVVVGSISPNCEAVRALVSSIGPSAALHIDTPHMAELMLDADLAIGACGVTSWERCTLGLPTLAVMAADNQRMIARELVRCGAVEYGGEWAELSEESLSTKIRLLLNDPMKVRVMAMAAADVCDGEGLQHIVSTVCKS